MQDNSAARLGILMLDTRFPRIRGDVGNAETWPFPVRYGVVAGATPQAIVVDDPEPFIDAFIAEGRTLVAEGCQGLATTCGFLSLVRPRLQAALGVPVAASALEQARQIVPMLQPGARLGVLTISAESLSARHLEVAGVPMDTIVQGMEGSRFAATILGNELELDVARAQQEMVDAARAMVARAPEVGAIIMECTNMVPYAPAISAATGRPIYSIYTYLRWFHAGLLPSSFDL